MSGDCALDVAHIAQMGPIPVTLRQENVHLVRRVTLGRAVIKIVT